MMNQKISSIPPKWIKHKLLPVFGLRDEEDLKSTIHRYKISEYEKCLKTIENEFNNTDENIVYIIKLVYKKSVYKLPNFLIQNREDILKCKDRLKYINQNQFTEIWYCKNNMQNETIYGRVAISIDELFPRQVKRKVEIVWGNSARQMEQYPNLQGSFLTAEIDGWGNSYRIIDSISEGKTKIDLEETLRIVLINLSKFHRRIVDFGKFVNECGCTELCIEFLIVNDGEFTIIDWDSDNDMKVIKKAEIYMK